MIGAQDNLAICSYNSTGFGLGAQNFIDELLILIQPKEKVWKYQIAEVSVCFWKILFIKL